MSRNPASGNNTMAQRVVDVWIVEVNTVYRGVPFAVVTDWLQQGRLLPADKVRASDKSKWHEIGVLRAFAPYLPRAEPAQAEDQAEALAPVELDVPVGTRHDEEDEDVDMIPLIDISLVLLIFFMMTASVSSGFLSFIKTPSAKHQLSTIARESYWVGIEPKSRSGLSEKGSDGREMPWYSVGLDQKELLAPTTDQAKVLELLTPRLGKEVGEVRIHLRADQTLPIEAIKGITLQLQALEGELNRGRPSEARLTFTISGEVSEPKGQ